MSSQRAPPNWENLCCLLSRDTLCFLLQMWLGICSDKLRGFPVNLCCSPFPRKASTWSPWKFVANSAHFFCGKFGTIKNGTFLSAPSPASEDAYQTRGEEPKWQQKVAFLQVNPLPPSPLPPVPSHRQLQLGKTVDGHSEEYSSPPSRQEDFRPSLAAATKIKTIRSSFFVFL